MTTDTIIVDLNDKPQTLPLSMGKLPETCTTKELANMLDMFNKDVMAVVDLVLARRITFGRYRTELVNDEQVHILADHQMETLLHYLEPNFSKNILERMKDVGAVLTRLQYRQVIANQPGLMADTKNLDSLCDGHMDPTTPYILI